MKIADRALAAHLASGCFIAIDPGTDHPAVAIFNQGLLSHASRVKIPTVKWRQLDEGERARLIVNACAEYALSYARTPVLAVVHEWPKAYARGKSKNSADHLFPLAAIGAGLAIKLDVRAISPIPFEWIGTIPKTTDPKVDPWTSPRGSLIHRRLSVLERLVVVANHDSIDSAGIGLWVLGRLARVYVGST